MFKNYFKIARRNLVRNKSYAVINATRQLKRRW